MNMNMQNYTETSTVPQPLGALEPPEALLAKVAAHLRNIGYDFEDGVCAGCLVIDAGDIPAAIEDGFGAEMLNHLKVHEEVADGGDEDEPLGTVTIVEVGETTSVDDRYRGRLEDAVADAAEAMATLNQYAKRARSRDVRNEIYSLKDGLLQALCSRGLCVGWWLHEREYEARGGYIHDDDLDDDFDDESEEEDSGSAVDVVRFISFRFVIRGKSYTWQCPEDRVRFDYGELPRLASTRTSVHGDEPPKAHASFGDLNLTEALDVVHYVRRVVLHGIHFGTVEGAQ